MDEILASIRRIIESSDDRPGVLKVEEDEPASPSPRPRIVGETGPMLRLASEQAVSRPATPENDPKADAVLSPRDEDDLARRLREEFEAEPFADWPSLDDTSSVARAEAAPAASVGAESTKPKEQDMRGLPADLLAELAAKAEGLEDTMSELEDEASSAPFTPANTDSPRMQEFRTAVLDDQGQEAKGFGDPLVSSRTGELVGASFDELARAIREGELRSLEDMAQEMLRPMLQDWLDDNLPKLVERLVREEIERVARGGRR